MQIILHNLKTKSLISQMKPENHFENKFIKKTVPIFIIQIKCVSYLFLQKQHIFQSMSKLFFLYFTTHTHAKAHERKMKDLAICQNAIIGKQLKPVNNEFSQGLSRKIKDEMSSFRKSTPKI